MDPISEQDDSRSYPEVIRLVGEETEDWRRIGFTVYLLLSAKGPAQNEEPKGDGPAWDKHTERLPVVKEVRS